MLYSIFSNLCDLFLSCHNEPKYTLKVKVIKYFLQIFVIWNIWSWKKWGARYTFWYIVLLTLYNGDRRIVHCFCLLDCHYPHSESFALDLQSQLCNWTLVSGHYGHLENIQTQIITVFKKWKTWKKIKESCSHILGGGTKWMQVKERMQGWNKANLKASKNSASTSKHLKFRTQKNSNCCVNDVCLVQRLHSWKCHYIILLHGDIGQMKNIWQGDWKPWIHFRMDSTTLANTFLFSILHLLMLNEDPT